MKAPKVCDLCPHPSKPVYGKAEAQAGSSSYLSQCFYGKRELCLEHYLRFIRAVSWALEVNSMTAGFMDTPNPIPNSPIIGDESR